jgi:hypothetical protein
MSMTAKARGTRLYSNPCPWETISMWANARDVTCVILLHLVPCFRPYISASIIIRKYTTESGADQRLMLNSWELPWASNSYSVELQTTELIWVDNTRLDLKEMFINMIVTWLRAELLLWRQIDHKSPNQLDKVGAEVRIPWNYRNC